MSKKFEEILESIVTDNNLEKEIESLDNIKEIYNVFKRDGYEHSEQEFEKEISKLLDEFSKENLSESELDEIAGGKQAGSKLLAGTLGVLSVLGAFSVPKSSGFDTYNVKNTVSDVKNTIVTKGKQIKEISKTTLPIALASVGGTVVVGGSTLLIGTALYDAAWHKYVTSIERDINELDKENPNYEQKKYDILIRIVLIVKDLNKDNSNSFKNNKLDSFKDNKKVQEFERLAIEFIKKVETKVEYETISDLYRKLIMTTVTQRVTK